MDMAGWLRSLGLERHEAAPCGAQRRPAGGAENKLARGA
jgi:hypothetical protein